MRSRYVSSRRDKKRDAGNQSAAMLSTREYAEFLLRLLQRRLLQIRGYGCYFIIRLLVTVDAIGGCSTGSFSCLLCLDLFDLFLSLINILEFVSINNCKVRGA